MTEENNNIGLSWKKCALHIHTPCSNDFEGNKDITPQEFLEKLTNSNIEVCAITDHSSFGWIEDLRAANEKLENPIIIFPGTEIHTDDGMHLLVLFERNSEISDLDHFLVNLDIKKEEFGSDKKCDRKMEGKEIIDKIHDYAALAIFPHVKQDKGFFKRFKGTSLKKEILKEGTYIFECDKDLIPDLKAHYEIPLIKKTDFHHEDCFDDENCYTWIKLDNNPNLDSLRQLVYDPNTRIRYEKPGSKNNCYIEKLFLACEYFEEEVIHFNPELNTIIGGRGTGKSLIIEILSYILGEYPDHNFYSLREYIHKLNTIINPMEKFAIEFRDETGDIYRLTRIFDKLPEINSPDENWQEKLDGYDEENPQKFEKKIEGEFIKKDGNEEWRNYLNINLYTQSSVANIGKDAESNLISTIDNFSHLSSKREDFLLAKEELKITKREIEGLEEKILEIYNDLDELSEIEDMISGKNIEINDIEKKISDPKIIHIGHLKEQNTKIKNFLNEIEGYTFPEYIPLPELKFVEGLEIELLDQIQRKFEQTKENYSNQCKEKEQFQKVILDFEDWLRKNWKDTYGNEIEKLGEENFESESSEAKLNEILNDKKEQRDKLIKKQIQNQDNLKKVQDLFAKRKDLIVKLKALNEEIFNFRERICRKIEGRMEVSNHRLSMKKDYNTTETIEILGEILYKITDKLTKIKIILKELNPYELVEIIQNPEESTDLIKKLNELNITPTTIERLTKYNYKNEVLSEFKIDELILHLERVLFNQKVLFEYKKNEKWRTITSLSPGEKCSSLMHLLLAQSNQILIIDQPEDELDYSSRSDLVKCIKERKEDRQIILVTHFQNIPVIADSDMIFLMEEDNKKSKIKKKGCFEKMILPIFQMEGGFEAIKLRYKKYSSKLEEEFLLETELEDAIRFGNNKQYNKALNILENIVIRSKEIGIKDISKRAIKKMEEYRKSINDL